MTADEYQALTARTAAKDEKIVHLALGLAGESGEVCDLIKKHYAQGHTMFPHQVVEELGDVLWYLARMAAKSGATLTEVMEVNIAKLKKRYPNGFEVDRSINREESGPP